MTTELRPRQARLVGSAAYLTFEYTAEDVRRAVKLLDGFRFSYEPEPHWTVPIRHGAQLATLLKRHGFTVPANLTKALKAQQRAMTKAAAQAAQRRVEHAAKADLRRAASTATAPLAALATGPLHPALRPFQQAGVGYMLDVRHCINADEMGLGKTLQTLATIDAAV